LYQAIAEFDKVLVTCFVSKYVVFTFMPSEMVFSNTVIVIASSRYDTLAVLQSSFHAAWVQETSSTLETRQRYALSDCYETFPRPADTHLPATCGKAYDKLRAVVMRERSEGLTKTYNRFHDPDEPSADIQKLRDLHVEMDNAVAAAYGWTDLDLGHGFHETKQGIRFTISEPARREVLQRLLKLNHERYAEEVKQGLHGKKGAARKAAPKKKATKAKDDQPTKPTTPAFDFGDEDE
jgi:hypothetical protein